MCTRRMITKVYIRHYYHKNIYRAPCHQSPGARCAESPRASDVCAALVRSASGRRRGRGLRLDTHREGVGPLALTAAEDRGAVVLDVGRRGDLAALRGFAGVITLTHAATGGCRAPAVASPMTRARSWRGSRRSCAVQSAHARGQRPGLVNARFNVKSAGRVMRVHTCSSGRPTSPPSSGRLGPGVPP